MNRQHRLVYKPAHRLRFAVDYQDVRAGFIVGVAVGFVFGLAIFAVIVIDAAMLRGWVP